MFQIPDDDEDDEFWKEFPLEEFENIPTGKGEKRQGSPLEKPLEEHKKPCTRNIENTTEQRLIPDSRLCRNILPSISTNNNNINNNNKPLRDVSLSSNKLLSDGTNPQRAGGHPENLASPVEVIEKHRTMTPGRIPENYSIRQQQTTPSDRCPKRKFPGPAGMLPRLVPGQKLTDTVMKLDGSADAQLQKNETLLSPNPDEDFFGGSPWLKLVSDLGEDSSRILKTFSIKELQHKACKKQLPLGKVMLLFTVLETVDLSSIDASVKLRDGTGSIQGTIHRNLVKEHGEHLQPGTVLVLKQVGVLSPTQRTHYLNITSNNLVSLYSTLPSGQVGIHWQEEGMTYRQLVTSAEMLQRSQLLTSPARPPPHFKAPVQSPPFQTPPVKNTPTVNRTPSSVQINPLRNVGTAKNSPLNCQAPVCDKISGLPSHNPVVPFGAPNPNSTTPGQYPNNNRGSSSFLNKELGKARQDVSPTGRSRWTFKSKASFSKEISGPSSSASSFVVPGTAASNTGALNSESSCHTFGNKNLKSPAPVSAGCSSNGVSVAASTGDKYRLRTENCSNTNLAINTNTTSETTSNVSDIWQDDLSDDILSQLSDDLF